MPRRRLVPALVFFRRGWSLAKDTKWRVFRQDQYKGPAPAPLNPRRGHPPPGDTVSGAMGKVPLPPPAPRASFLAHTVKPCPPLPPPLPCFPACPDRVPLSSCAPLVP